MTNARYLLFLVFSFSALPQTLEDRAKELQKTLSAGVPVTSEGLRTVAIKYFDFLTDMLWDDQFKSLRSKLPSRRPTIVVKPDTTDGIETPHAGSDTVVFPVSYFEYLATIAQLLGHDIAVKENSLSTSRNRLLAEPFADDRLLPLLMPLNAFSFSPDNVLARASFLNCADADAPCKAQLGVSVLALSLFVLSHELSHVRFGHTINRNGEHSLADEIAADGNAFTLLEEVGKTLVPDAHDVLRKPFVAAPIVWLTIEAGRTSGAAENEKIARRAALLKLLPDEDRDDVEEMIEPDHSDIKLGRLRTTWNGTPDHLYVDGLLMDPSAILGKFIVVASGRHTAIGLTTGIAELCYASAIVDDGGEANLPLRCEELHDVAAAELLRLEKARAWFELLTHTSNEELAPKRPELAFFHGEALHRLGFGRLIPTSDWTALSVKQQRELKVWQELDVPLGSWY